MKQGLLILLLACAMAAAMVPRMRRSEPTETTETTETTEKTENTETTKNTPVICAPTTPCAWSFYNREYDRIEMNITNNYCICSADRSCEVYVDDSIVDTLVYHCLKPKKV